MEVAREAEAPRGEESGAYGAVAVEVAVDPGEFGNLGVALPSRAR